MRLMNKELLLDQCPVLWHKELTEDVLREDFDVRSGQWRVEEGWLYGENAATSRHGHLAQRFLRERFAGVHGEYCFAEHARYQRHVERQLERTNQHAGRSLRRRA
jgi:hypothetical protein